MKSITALLIGALVLWGCSEEPPSMAERAWNKNIETVERAIAGEGLDDFEASCIFLQELTGIKAKVDGSYVGSMPYSGTRDSVREWKAWYRVNQSRLYWDEGSARVLLK